MYEDDPYWQRAEFFVARNYVPAGTDIAKLAERLKKADERNKAAGTGVQNTRDAVYGENAGMIEKMMDQKSPVEKRILGPYETITNKKELDSL